MSARSNPPSFVVIDSVTGRIGYTKRATGMGNEAIAACVAKARELARRTGHSQIVFLELRKLYIGQQLNVGMVRTMGITEEVHPDGSVTRSNPRRAVRRNIFNFNNPRKHVCDDDCRSYGCKFRGRGVRKNIFVFNNPHDSRVESAARAVGLFVGTWSPGDGQTRYRFFTKNSPGSTYADYHQGDGIYTALGRKDALAFIAAYGKGRSARTNPRRRELSYPARAFIGSEIRHLRRKGYEQKRAVAAAYSIARRKGYRVNPGVCPNPVIRGDKLPLRLQQEVLRKYIYRWTSDNSQREYAWRNLEKPRIPLITDAQWLREHAFHVTGKGELDLRHIHAEPYYMADDWKKGDPRPNPSPTSFKRGDWVVKVNGDEYSAGSVEGYNGGPTVTVRWYLGASKYDAWYKTPVSYLDENSIIDSTGVYIMKLPRKPVIGSKASFPSTAPWISGGVRPNPLLQTVFAANPPISEQWDRMTPRQKQAAAEYAGLGEDLAYLNMRRSWKNLMPQVKRELEASWLDTTSRGGTTRRRSAVAVNPLTRSESAKLLNEARNSEHRSRPFPGQKGKSYLRGYATGLTKAVSKFGPKSAKQAANRMFGRTSIERSKPEILKNPGVRLPRPGTRLTIQEALDLARRIGDRSLIEQCQKALKLQKAANKNAKCVIWKTFAMGSKDKIDSVVALTHYGDSPETMYKPPKGSKKGQHMYRHKWGEGSNGKKTVPLLASADGKMLLMPLEGKKVAADWLRH